MARVPEVLVVDQDPQGRYEVKQLVKHAQLGFAGEAGFGTEAISLASEAQPDVVLCGMSVPPERSLRTIEALLDVLPETPVIAYARREDVEAVRQTMLAGARDFLIIPASPSKLMESISSVLESEERKRLRLSGQAKGLGPKGLIVAVFGAKGGVGKTTLATNVGAALASGGQSVVIVDADNSFGDVAATLELKSDRSIVDLAREFEAVERTTVTNYLLRHESGVWVLPAPRESLQWRSVPAEKVRGAIDVLARRFDIVLVDTAAALTDVSLAVLEEASIVLWVTSTDFSSINNSLMGLEALRQLSYPESRIRLVLNITSSDDTVRPAKIEEVLKRRFFWTIPYDKNVRTGSQIGNPAALSSPNSNGSRAFLNLAQAITGGGGAEQPQPEKPKRTWPFARRSEETEAAPVSEGG